MKKIMLAKKGKRILSRLIDMSIVFALTFFIFIVFIYPNKFDKKKFDDNNLQIIELYKDSGLFVVDSKGNYNAKCTFNNIITLDDIYSLDVSYGGVVYEDISLTKSLYEFYTTKFNTYSKLNNLTYDLYCANILKIGTNESNIKSFNVDNYTFELIDENTPDVTIIHLIEQYKVACNSVMTCEKVNSLTLENQQLMLNSITPIIPLLIAISFIFDFIIPICSKKGQTIGKHIFGLVLVDKDGYKFKKKKHVLRFISYLGIEIILGFITMGGAILISYTMFMFKKNRRCIHDVISGSVVIDKKESFYFDSPVEERYYEERSKRKGLIYE